MKRSTSYQVKKAWEAFRIYCSDANLTNKLSKAQFSTRLAVKRIPGVGESRVMVIDKKHLRGKILHLNLLREHFEIYKYDFI